MKIPKVWLYRPRLFSKKYNERLGRNRRFCENCGVPMSFMTKTEYRLKHKKHLTICSKCKLPTVRKEIEDGDHFKKLKQLMSN